jgi:hypothetical protein
LNDHSDPEDSEESEESTDAEEPSNVPPARARKYEKDSNPKSDVSNIFSDGEEVFSARKARAAKVPDESDFSEDQLPGQKVNPTKSSKVVPKPSDPSRNKHALLAGRVWDCKEIIDPLMEGPEGRTDIFVWTNLLDEFKVHKYNAKKLNAGTNIPPAIVNGARTGSSVHVLLKYRLQTDLLKQLGTAIEVLRSSETLSSQCMTTNLS